jgi:hypothetical protein
MSSSNWVAITEGLPEEGTYLCKIISNGSTIEREKILVREGEHHKWFGGCRPFCENDIVTHYIESPPKGK